MFKRIYEDNKESIVGVIIILCGVFVILLFVYFPSILRHYAIMGYNQETYGTLKNIEKNIFIE